MTTRPKLADLKKICPQDLAHCDGYVWHLGSRIGKGSFGEVYFGWNTVKPPSMSQRGPTALGHCHVHAPYPLSRHTHTHAHTGGYGGGGCKGSKERVLQAGPKSAGELGQRDTHPQAASWV